MSDVMPKKTILKDVKIFKDLEEEIIKTKLIISIADKNNGLPESATAEMIMKIIRHNTVNTVKSKPT